MKFSTLVEKFEKISDKVERGQRVKPDKLADLQGLLREKITRYESKLGETTDDRKRAKLEKRLRVVRAQLQKSADLLSSD